MLYGRATLKFFLLILAGASAALCCAEFLLRALEPTVQQRTIDIASTLPQWKENRPATCTALHPLWGFSTRAASSLVDCAEAAQLHRIDPDEDWISARANNWGFFSPYNYPPQSNDSSCAVGLFGGSFAAWLAITNLGLLEQEFAKRAPCTGKPVKVLNFASFGFKQPQPSIIFAVLASLGIRLDLVLLLDGFNESALSSLNVKGGWAPWLPSVQHLAALESLLRPVSWDRGGFARQAHLYLDQQSLDELEIQIRQSHFAIHRLLLRYRISVLRARIQARQLLPPAPPSELSAFQIDQPAVAGNTEDEILNVWAESAQLMADQVYSRGGTFVHVLQPNQYFSDRLFSPEEARIALADNSPYRIGVRAFYPLFRSRGNSLKNGLFIDATGIFDHTPGTVYVDSCCHVTRSAYKLVVTYILNQLDKRPTR